MKHLILIGFLLASLAGTAQDYFQQEVNSRIHVELDDETHRLKAHIRMEYINHSASTLNEMYIHLWPNAYANDETAMAKQLFQMEMTDFYFSEDSARGSISGLDFRINGEQHSYTAHQGHIDIARIALQQPLKPGDTLWIETPFEVDIPSNAFSRLGHEGKSYQITQWFPKPAVFDQKGWHPMPYLSVGEFYSEFGSYDVSIRVPVNYRVAASGNLQNTREKEWLMALAENKKKVAHPYSADSTHKTLRYQLDNVHDFAWFADPEYLVRQKITLLDNGHEVQCWAFFLEENAYTWDEAVNYLERSTQFYSRHVGAYPYKVVTAVDGALAAGGGMEYPTITVIGSGGDNKDFEEVLMHEVGHNWFYGMLGFNEREQPWLDEGLNSFYQHLYMQEFYPDDLVLDRLAGDFIPNRLFGQNNYLHRYQTLFSHRLLESRGIDMPMNYHSEDFGMYSYFIGVYMKPVIYLYHLRAYLGNEEWESIMKSFFHEWRYKHPQQEDFIRHLEEQASKDVRWFTRQALSSTGRMDYKISRVKKSDKGFDVTVRNKGNVHAPVLLKGEDINGQTVYSEWIDSVGQKQTVSVAHPEIVRFEINKGLLTDDARVRNNSARSQGIGKTLNNPLPKMLYHMPQTERSPLYYLPIYGWNVYDRSMVGLALYNDWLFDRKFHFRLQPMYSFESARLTGMGEMYYHMYTSSSSFLHRVSLGVRAQSYGQGEGTVPGSNTQTFPYRVIKPEVELRFRNKAYQRKLQNKLRLSWNYIEKDVLIFTSATQANVQSQSFDLFKLDYEYSYPRTVNPFGLKASVESNLDRWKLGAEFEYFLTYKQPENGLRIRAFAGTFMGNGHLGYSEEFRLSSWRGKEDYLYDHLYLDRYGSYGNSYWTQQMTIAEGGFAVPAFQRSGDWILSTNVSTSLPFISGICLYGSLAAMPDAFTGDAVGYYEAGLYLTFWKRALEIYFPVVWSDEIDKTNELNKVSSYISNYIRFTVDFNRINPFDYLRNIKF